MKENFFTEQEIQKIIKKAAELQQNDSINKKNQENGLTMDELLEVGKDSGLDVEYLKTAALEIRDKKVVRYSGLNDTHIFEERDFDTDLSNQEIWDEVLVELNHHFGGNMFGMAKNDKRKNEWSHTSISGIETIVSLTKRGKSSKLRLSQRVGLGSPLTEGILYGGVLAAIATSMTISAISPIFTTNILLGLGFWGISSMLVYALDVAWRKRKLKSLNSLADKISSQIQSSLTKIKSTTNTSMKKEKAIPDIEIDMELDAENETENKEEAINASSKLKNHLRI